MDTFQSVLGTIKKAWEQLEPELLREILSTDVRYYETPNDTPLTTAQDVIEQWSNDLATQSKVKMDYQIIQAKDNVCIATWHASWNGENQTTVTSQGVFYIALDKAGKLIEFRQWWV